MVASEKTARSMRVEAHLQPFPSFPFTTLLLVRLRHNVLAHAGADWCEDPRPPGEYNAILFSDQQREPVCRKCG